jgi:hypothetical protein
VIGVEVCEHDVANVGWPETKLPNLADRRLVPVEGRPEVMTSGSETGRWCFSIAQAQSRIDEEETSFGFGEQHVRHQPAGGPTRPHGAAVEMMDLHVGMLVTRRMSASNVRSGRRRLNAIRGRAPAPTT